MPDELYDALLRFHREVVRPELDELRKELRGEMQSIRSEMATKADLQAVRAEMATKADLQAVRAEMATKADLQAVRAEMIAMRAEMVTWPVLMRYHEQIVRPEVEEVRLKLAEFATRDELLTHVDGIYLRLDQLTSEYHALTEAVRRLEDQMTQQKVDIGVVQSELVRINDQISQLSQRVTKLENVLN